MRLSRCVGLCGLLCVLALLSACGVGPVDAGVDEPAPDAGEVDAGPAPPCEGTAGTFREQVFPSGGEDRAYFLHVPESYRCETASALLIHFHGTAGGPPEERWQLDAHVATADQEGYILVRPRSRGSPEAQPVYRWDQNPGDIARNITFTHDLLDDLEGRYHVDKDRLYMSGFSSGAHMVAQLLADQGLMTNADDRRFKGAAPLAGGTFTDISQVSFAPDELRVYAATGHRDYLLLNHRILLNRLTRGGLAPGQILRRTSDAGHGHSPWHPAELYAWLDRGERPDPGAIGAGWTELDPVDDDESLLAIEGAPDGDLVVTGAAGTIFKGPDLASLNAVGEVVLATDLLDPDPFRIGLPALCLDADGNGYAAGESVLVQTLDGGETWARIDGVPEYNVPLGYGSTVANALSCWLDDEVPAVLAAGYWNTTKSTDGAVTWTESTTAFLGGDAQVAALARDAQTGTIVGVGWLWAGTSDDDGATFAETNTFDLQQGWLSDVVSVGDDRFVAVGDLGDVLVSTDGGASWSVVASPVGEDLYAVAARDQTLLAVGRRGVAILSQDGGDTWVDVSTGLDAFLADVLIDDDGQGAQVVGGEGTRLRLSFP